MSSSIGLEWEESKTMDIQVMTCTGLQSSPAIAAFDLDGTLITTKSGNVFPRHPNDWRLLYEPQIQQKLKKLHYDEGFKIVVITNQGGMATGQVKKEDFRNKISEIVKAIDVPIQLFCSISKYSVFRKPRPGTWEYLEKYKNSGIPIDRSRSFYCGDAAGRNRKPKGKKDFSCSDRLFAANVGVKFLVPEELFLNQPCTYPIDWPEFNPKNLIDSIPPLLEHQNINDSQGSAPDLTLSRQEVIVMVGVQGSGKSFFAENYLAKAGYTVISNDKTGSRDKSLNLMKKVLSNGKSVVVDNTHVNPEARKKFIDMAKQFAIPCRCFTMNTSASQVRHNLIFREITGKDHAHIGEAIINGYYSKFKPPTKEEGFTDILKINLIPDFKYEQHHSLYHMYLVEKK